MSLVSIERNAQLKQYRACAKRFALLSLFVLQSYLTGFSRTHTIHSQTADSIKHDRLENAEEYFRLHPLFSDAFEFLQRPDLAELAPGRYDILGDRLFCKIEIVPGRSREEASLEAHCKYIDIQFLIRGNEEMGWRRTSTCTQVKQPYDAAMDIGFFDDSPETTIKMTPGSFVIFFPKDAHAPLIGKGEIHKAVLKVRLDP